MGVEGCVEYVVEVRWLEAGVEEEYIAFLINVLNTKITSRSGTFTNSQALGLAHSPT